MKVIPNKTKVETFKTVLISVLITAIIAFVVGVKYEQGQNQHILQAVQAAAHTQSK